MKKMVVIAGIIVFGVVIMLSFNRNQNNKNYINNNLDYVNGVSIETKTKDIDNVVEFSEETKRFQIMIAELMYDKEYEIVKKLIEYYPSGVELALEIEFGVKNINTIIEYIEKASTTVAGMREICNKVVFQDEMGLLPAGISCAHAGCVANNSSNDNLFIKNE